MVGLVVRLERRDRGRRLGRSLPRPGPTAAAAAGSAGSSARLGLGGLGLLGGLGGGSSAGSASSGSTGSGLGFGAPQAASAGSADGCREPTSAFGLPRPLGGHRWRLGLGCRLVHGIGAERFHRRPPASGPDGGPSGAGACG